MKLRMITNNKRNLYNVHENIQFHICIVFTDNNNNENWDGDFDNMHLTIKPFWFEWWKLWAERDYPDSQHGLPCGPHSTPHIVDSTGIGWSFGTHGICLGRFLHITH